MKIKYNENMITGALFLAIGIFLRVVLPAQIRLYETSSINARTVPMMLVRGMILFSGIILLQGLFSSDKKELILFGGGMSPEKLKKLKPLLYIAMLLVYAVVMPRIGFIPASLLLANGILLYFGSRKWWYYAIASANVLVVFFAFQSLNVYLP